MENEALFNIVNTFFEKNPPPYFSFDYGRLIPLRKLKNARKLYASYDTEKEFPLLLVDETFFRSAKKGILLTNLHLYYRLYTKRGRNEIKKGKLPLNQITTIYIDIGRMGSDLMINNKKEAFTTAFGVDEPKKTEAKVLNSLFKLIISSIN